MRTGIAIFFLDKVSFLKHPNVDVLYLTNKIKAELAMSIGLDKFRQSYPALFTGKFILQSTYSYLEEILCSADIKSIFRNHILSMKLHP